MCRTRPRAYNGFMLPADAQIGFIGPGNMAQALVRGLIDGAQLAPTQVTVAGPRAARLAEFGRQFGVHTTTDNVALARTANVLVLAVKPQILPKVLAEIRPARRPDALVISIAAGVTATSISDALGSARVVRAMPNTPALVGAGATALARGPGATDADAVLSDSASVSVTRRNGEPESLVRSEEAEIGLRVLVGGKQAIVSSSDRSPEALQQMAERAVAMARMVPEDKFAGLADPADIAKSFPDLDLYDATDLSVEKMTEMADTAENAALDVEGITNSDGAECSVSKETSYYAATNGFVGGYSASGFSLSVSVIAGEDTQMETDYDFDSAAFLKDLADPLSIGRSAGERAVKALNPRKGPTKTMPVVFDRRMAGGIIGSLAGAISGSAVARGTTFLKDSMGKQIFPANISVIDDPFLKRGARSHPFDGEGVTPQKRSIIDNGVLTGWLLDTSSAKQLGLKTTGNAARSASSPPRRCNRT